MHYIHGVLKKATIMNSLKQGQVDKIKVIIENENDDRSNHDRQSSKIIIQFWILCVMNVVTSIGFIVVQSML